MDISSTGIRRMLSEGKSARYLLPDAVHELILDRGLYGARRDAEKRVQEERLSGSKQE